MFYTDLLISSSTNILAVIDLSFRFRIYAIGFVLFVVLYIILIRTIWEQMALMALKFFEKLGVESEFVIRASIAALIVVAFFTPPGLFYLATRGMGGNQQSNQLSAQELAMYRGPFIKACDLECRKDGNPSECTDLCICLWDHLSAHPDVGSYLEDPDDNEELMEEVLLEGASSCVPEGRTFDIKPIQAKSVSEGQTLEEFYASADGKENSGNWYTSNEKGYKEHCSGCHDIGLVGAPKLGDSERWKSILDERNRHDLVNNAVTGKGGHPKNGGCDTCSVDDIGGMTAYMLEQAK